VGIRVRVTVGQKVHKGDPLFTVYAKTGAKVDTALYQDTVAWSEVAPKAKGWLLGSIGC